MLDIAMALRLKGIASNEHIAEITGKGQSDVDDVLNMMQEKLYAQQTPRGPVSYTHLTLPTTVIV